VVKVLTGPNGEDLIAQLAGAPAGVTRLGASAWKGVVGAGAQTDIAVHTQGQGVEKELSPPAREAIDRLAALRGYILSQDAVLWHLPVFNDAKLRHNGVDIRTARALTVGEVQTLYNAFREQFGIDDLAPAVTARGARILNFVEGLDNKTFQAGVDKVVLGLPEDFGGGAVTYPGFRAESSYLENNWKEHPDGEGYKSRFATGRPDLLRGADDLKACVQAVTAEFSARYGWGRSDEAGDRRAGGVLPQYGQGPEDSVEVVAVHFSAEQRTQLSYITLSI
jgi:hypothetical protein